jgi:hypothetical protein
VILPGDRRECRPSSGTPWLGRHRGGCLRMFVSARRRAFLSGDRRTARVGTSARAGSQSARAGE